MKPDLRETVMKEILKDLRAGQATADALSETLGRSHDLVRSALGSLMETGAISSAWICGGTLTVYRLAPATSPLATP